MDSLQKNTPKKKYISSSEKVVFPPEDENPPYLSTPLSSDSAFFRPRKNHQKHLWSKMLLFTLSSFLIILLSLLGFLVYKSMSVGQTIQLNNTSSSSFFAELKNLASTIITRDDTLLKKTADGRINILLLGHAGKKYPGKNLTDTIILMSVDTVQKKITLLSLPRDLYAPIPETSLFTKINALYQYGLSNSTGLSVLQSSIEEITGQKIHYSFLLDFDGFEKIIDTLGGISIDVVRDFYDPRYPGKNYSYETFEIKKGWQTLDGPTALKYVRERHNDPEGDFGRAKRQQQVIQAVRDKAFSLGTALNFFAIHNLLDILGESVQTDMTLEEMEKFIQLIKTLDTKNITSVVVDAWKKESLLRVSHIQVGPIAMFVLVPRTGNWNEIQDLSKNIFDLNTLQQRKQKILDEKPSITLVTTPENRTSVEKMKILLQTMGFQNITTISSHTLRQTTKESILETNTTLTKPYSLDELMQKFPFKKNLISSSSSPPSPLSDFTLTLGEDIIEMLTYDEADIQEIPEETTVPEIFEPQEKIKHKK